MTRRFEREIEAFNRLTARKGELAAAVEDARRAVALSLKAIGREEAFDTMNSAIDEAVAGARLLEPANVRDWPSGSIERRSAPSRGFGARRPGKSRRGTLSRHTLSASPLYVEVIRAL